MSLGWRAAARWTLRGARWTAAVVAGLVVAIAAISWITGGQLLAVQSGSMAPGIPIGSLAIIRPPSVAQVQHGDVIAFESGGRRVLHRVETVTNPDGQRRFVTKGDANRTADPEIVDAAQVSGEMWFSLPRLGRVANALQPPWGFVWLGLLPALLSLVSSRLERKLEPRSVAHSWTAGDAQAGGST